jgi:hypothetical protein
VRYPHTEFHPPPTRFGRDLLSPKDLQHSQTGKGVMGVGFANVIRSLIGKGGKPFRREHESTKLGPPNKGEGRALGWCIPPPNLVSSRKRVWESERWGGGPLHLLSSVVLIPGYALCRSVELGLLNTGVQRVLGWDTSTPNVVPIQSNGGEEQLGTDVPPPHFPLLEAVLIRSRVLNASELGPLSYLERVCG